MRNLIDKIKTFFKEIFGRPLKVNAAILLHEIKPFVEFVNGLKDVLERPSVKAAGFVATNMIKGEIDNEIWKILREAVPALAYSLNTLEGFQDCLLLEDDALIECLQDRFKTLDDHKQNQVYAAWVEQALRDKYDLDFNDIQEKISKVVEIIKVSTNKA